MNDNRNDQNDYGSKDVTEMSAAEPSRWDSGNPAEHDASHNGSDQKRVMSIKGGGRGKHNNPGNFANDRTRAAAAGRKGGEARGHRHHQQH